jgi:hypothetical protein
MTARLMVDFVLLDYKGPRRLAAVMPMISASDYGEQSVFATQNNKGKQGKYCPADGWCLLAVFSTRPRLTTMRGSGRIRWIKEGLPALLGNPAPYDKPTCQRLVFCTTRRHHDTSLKRSLKRFASGLSPAEATGI